MLFKQTDCFNGGMPLGRIVGARSGQFSISSCMRTLSPESYVNVIHRKINQ